ncbi:hypothetical protein SBRCBS47491_007742 [Sporothrix bragantina]|uniref:Ubiquitin-like protease family profile domain-containing protein n=1 Tax=Sporothrix bragantina TaxID=671064 RepID=A0ABP0CFP6_9PEZI
MPLPKFLGQFNPVNFLGGRSPKRREPSQTSPQIQPPPPKRRRTGDDDDNIDDARLQRPQSRGQQRLRSRPSETSIDVLIQSPPDRRQAARAPSVSVISSSHKGAGGRNNVMGNQPELRQVEQYVQTPRSRRRKKHRGGSGSSKFGGSLDRPANMKSPSPFGDDDDVVDYDYNGEGGGGGDSEMLCIVDDDTISSPKKAVAAAAANKRVNTNLAVILSDGRPNNASKGRFRERMMMDPLQKLTKRYNESESGDELSQEFFPGPSAKRQQPRQRQQQSRGAVVDYVDLSLGHKRNRSLQTSNRAVPVSSPKSSPKTSPKTSPASSVPSRSASASIPMLAEAIKMSSLSVKSAFRQPDCFFMSDTDAPPLSLTIDDRDPDLLVPLEQARARTEKLHWLRVDLLKARQISYHINSPFVFFSFPQGEGLGAMLGIKFTSAENARQLVAWATNSAMSQAIKFIEAASPEQQKRKFLKCLADVLERKESVTGGTAAAPPATSSPAAAAASPEAKISPPRVTNDLLGFRRTRSSRSTNGATEMIDLDDAGDSEKKIVDGGSPGATAGAGLDRAMRLRNRGTRTSAVTRPLLQDMEFERWTVKNPDWAKDWRIPLTYSRTTVDKDDVARLDEGEFLNDNIINFYMQFLQDTLKKSESSIAKRVYFHNTFFYEKLRPSRGREIAFDGVKRWTAKVDLFSYDYIVVPVNEHAHWWLAIICNVPKILAAALPEETKEGGLFDMDEDKDEKPETTETTAAAAETIDVDSHRPQSVVVEDDDGHKDDNDVKFVSVASKKTSTSPPRLNGLQRDTPIDVDEARAGEKRKEPIVLDSVETDDAGVKAKTDVSTATAIEIHDGEKGEKDGKAKDEADTVYAAAKNDDDDDDDDEVTEIKSDIVQQPSTPQQTPTKKGGFRGAAKNKKKVFIPPGKKQDPTDPRIFTLDSLGSVHSASVDHLKQWLMAEIAERKTNGVAPKDPGRLGMTAKAIPQQENFCDCGVYLLLYLQEFVKDPDSFIEDIVLRQERAWHTSAPDMRKQLRDLILHMQREYQAAEEASRKPKKKAATAATTSAAAAAAAAAAKRFALAEAAKPSSPLPTPAAAETVVESPSLVQVSSPANVASNSADVPIPTSEMDQEWEGIQDEDNHEEPQRGSQDEASVSPIDPVEAGLSSPFASKSASPTVFKPRP